MASSTRWSRIANASTHWITWSFRLQGLIVSIFYIPPHIFSSIEPSFCSRHSPQVGQREHYFCWLQTHRSQSQQRHYGLFIFWFLLVLISCRTRRSTPTCWRASIPRSTSPPSSPIRTTRLVQRPFSLLQIDMDCASLCNQQISYQATIDSTLRSLQISSIMQSTFLFVYFCFACCSSLIH